MDDRREGMVQLAQKRKELADLQEIVRELEAEIAETYLGQKRAETKEQISAIKMELEAIETQEREAALYAFAAEGDKHPWEGITIKVFKRLEYNVPLAKAWAAAHAPHLLTLDIKAFEKVAVELGAPVKVLEEPQAQLASKLDAYL